MNRSRSALVVCLCILGLVASGQAQARLALSTQKLIVGVKEAPPFAIKQDDNTWSGLSIELWQAIATDLQLSYTWRELDLPGLLQGVTFPATKQELLRLARANHVEPTVLHRLEQVADRSYGSLHDLMTTLSAA